MKKDFYCVDCQTKVTKKHQKRYPSHLVGLNRSKKIQEVDLYENHEI